MFDTFFSLFLPDFSRQNSVSPFPKHLKLNLFIFTTLSSVFSLHFSLVWSLFHLCIIQFMHFFTQVLGFENFWGFSKLKSVSQNFWVGFYLNDFKSSCIASHLNYNDVSSILDVCLLCCNDVCWYVWIGLSPWYFFFCMSHVHAFFMHFSCIFHALYSYIDLCWCFSAYFSLSLPLFRRTFVDDAFIQNTKSSYRIFLILTFPLSSTVGVGSHCMASQSRALPWSYRSFTPTCMDLTILYLISSLVFKVRAL